MLRDKPIIKELNYTKEEIAEVKRIQAKEPITKRKEKMRKLLQGPMCCICAQIPKKMVEYNLGGVIRIESYCEICFPIYERNKEMSIDDIAETYNCTIAPPGTFGGSKIEGYSKTAKSSLSGTYFVSRPKRNSKLSSYSILRSDGFSHQLSTSLYDDCNVKYLIP